MVMTIERLKEIDAREQRDRPVLPKGKYVVEMGELVAKAIESNKGDFVQVSCALSVKEAVGVFDDDLEAACESWNADCPEEGTVEDMLEATTVWFRKNIYDDSNIKELHTALVKATGRDDLPGDFSQLAKATKGLTVVASVNKEVYDGTWRNTDVRKLLPVK